MSKAILICPRRPDCRRFGPDDIRTLSDRLCPDNISPPPPLTAEHHGALLGVLNPVDTVAVEGASACLGFPRKRPADWHRPGAPAPDGTFALFRTSDRAVELCTNILASRNIWYAHTDDLFVASSSQRAVVALLGGLELNRSAIPWFLSTGTPGPGQPWDRRIRFLGPDGRLWLDREAWTVNVEEAPVLFEPSDRPRDEQLARLRAALDEAFEDLPIEPSQWLLPLSSGFDSRAILVYMAERGLAPPCVTWGLAEHQHDPSSDLSVARQLAQHYGLEHRYYRLDPSAATVEQFLDRFVALCEAREDGVEGYVDGFDIWRRLLEDGACGVIRGEQAFGEPPVHTEADARMDRKLALFSDYTNLGEPEQYGFGPQELPDTLERRPGESLATWRDRLYQQYTMPYVFGCLNELKAWYVETLDPLTSRSIVETVRTLPDRLRDDKALFRDLVRAISPDIPLGAKAIVPDPWDVMRTRDVVEHIRAELDTSGARELLSGLLVDRILDGARVMHESVPRQRKSVRDRVKRVIPQSVRKKLRSSVLKPALDWNALAFRAYVISRFVAVLRDDAICLGSE